MDIEKIEETLANIFAMIEEGRAAGTVSASDMLLAMQCQLLLAVYRRLDHIDDMVIAIERVVNP